MLLQVFQLSGQFLAFFNYSENCLQSEWWCDIEMKISNENIG